MTIRPFRNPPTGDVAIAWWVISLYWYGLFTTLGLAGPASEAERAFVPALVIGGVLIAAGTAGGLAQFSAALVACAAALYGPSENARLWSYLLFGALTFGVRGRSWMACVGTATLFVLGVEAQPDAGNLVEGFFGPLTRFVLLAPPGERLSLSAHGGLVTVCALIAVAWHRRGSRPLVRVGFAVWIVALWLVQYPLGAAVTRYIGVYASHGHAPGLFANLPVQVLLTSLIVGLSWAGGLSVANTQRADLVDRRTLRRTWSTAAIALFLGFACWSAFQGLPSVRSKPGPKTVLFLNHGGFDWDRPTTQEVGAFSGGMFGLLPVYLQHAGWDVKTVRAVDLDRSLVGAGQVLVLINCPHEWGGPERARIREFLEAGGGLLVLGDHTDIFGCARGGNTLLAEHGIRFRFDSAYFLGRSWRRELEWCRAEPQTSVTAHDAGIAVGASLALEGPAFPIVTARYGFGDAGIRNNVTGAFLGDYRFQPDERLGDLCVVAGARIGKGSLRVYGDTSAFQNAALESSFHTHVAPVLDRLASSNLDLPWSLVTSLALGGISLTLWGLFRALQSSASLWLGCWAAACLTDLPVRWSDARQTSSVDAVLVDRTHGPRIGDAGGEWNEIWPFKMAALRTGAIVLDFAHWDPRILERARGLLLVAPTSPYGREERIALRRFVEHGGTLVCCATGRDATALAPVLDGFGVGIMTESVGSVPEIPVQRPDLPRLLDASPLQFERRPGDVALIESGGAVFALARPVDRGWLVVIGDTRVMSSANVESTTGEWPGNQRLLIDLCVRFLRGRLDVARETLPAPFAVDVYGQPEVE